jgi:hypothetical protein
MKDAEIEIDMFTDNNSRIPATMTPLLLSQRLERSSGEPYHLSYNKHAKSMALMVWFNLTLAEFSQQTSTTSALQDQLKPLEHAFVWYPAL